MKSKADYKTALQIVRAAIHRWDPYSLLACGCPKDEFDSEIASVVVEVPRIRSRQDAARAISRVFTAAFHADGFAPDDCAKVGADLFNALVENGLIERRSET